MLAKLVTEQSDFSWNKTTQLFETRIYATDETGKRQVVMIYSTPPRIFLKDAMSVQRAVADFYVDTEHPQAKVIQMKLGSHG